MKTYNTSASSSRRLNYTIANSTPPSSCVNAAPMTRSCVAIYNLNASLTLGARNTGGVTPDPLQGFMLFWGGEGGGGGGGGGGGRGGGGGGG
jgi:hypothetical protein